MRSRQHTLQGQIAFGESYDHPNHYATGGKSDVQTILNI